MKSSEINPSHIFVDASSFIYRAFFALPPLTSPKGIPTGATRGFINMIEKLMNTWPDAGLVIVYDHSATSFRNDLYEPYKANRESMPDEMRTQLEYIKKYVDYRGLKKIDREGYEADDVISSLAATSAQAGELVLIASSDKDFCQIVNDNIYLYDSMKDSYMTPVGVLEKYGVPPQKMIDFQTLVGDSTDNIPGVVGIGPKGATKLLNEYGSVAEIVRAAQESKLTPGQTQKLLDCYDSGDLDTFRQLVTLKQDLPVTEDLNQEWEPNQAELEAMLEELGFSKKPAEKKKTKEVKVLWSLLPEQLDELAAEHISAADDLILLVLMDDLEDALSPAVLALMQEKQSQAPDAADVIIAARFTPEMAAAATGYINNRDFGDKRLVVPNLKEAIAVVKGLQEQRCFDPVLGSYVCDPGGFEHSLQGIAKRLDEPFDLKVYTGTGSKKKAFNVMDTQTLDELLKLHLTLIAAASNVYGTEMRSNEKLERLYESVEAPLTKVLVSMEEVGICIDADKLGEQAKDLTERKEAVQQRVLELAPTPVNIDSPKDLKRVLYDEMGIRLGVHANEQADAVSTTTEKAPTSTAEPILSEIAKNGYEIAAKILEYRSLSKLLSTYVEPLKRYQRSDKRVHTRWQQTVASTGRLSSVKPNLQNIPIKSEDGKKVRSVFVAPPGKVLVVADYSQVELRIMAHICEDMAMTEAFVQGLDIHSATAAELFRVDVEAVDEHMRRTAKAINFGLIYGMSAFGLSQALEIPQKEAKSYIETYFERYPGVRLYMDWIKSEAKAKKEVWTMFGRRIKTPDITAQNHTLRSAAERAAINAPVQGSAADLIKLAMLRYHDWTLKENIDAPILLQVHDELVIETAEENQDIIRERLIEIMEGVIALKVPLRVDTGTGSDWSSAHA